jgi:hypothetical protein
VTDPVIEWVEMTHPGVHTDPDTAPARVTREAFESVWAPNGWTEIQTTPAAPATTARPMTPTRSSDV